MNYRFDTFYMHHAVMKDLMRHKARAIQAIRDAGKFNANISYAGYFLTGEEAERLQAAATHPVSPGVGFHATCWHHNKVSLDMHGFLDLMTANQFATLDVVGYADDGLNQAIKINRPKIFMHPVIPHVTISIEQGANSAASGYLSFSDEVPKELNLPSTLHGSLGFIGYDKRPKDMTWFRESIRAVEINRMQQIGEQLPPEVKRAIDKACPFDVMPWEQLKSQFISTGLEFNEEMAALYAKYLVDTTDNKMQERQTELDEHDKDDNDENHNGVPDDDEKSVDSLI